MKYLDLADAQKVLLLLNEIAVSRLYATIMKRDIFAVFIAPI
jgi:hypothetical protein